MQKTLALTLLSTTMAVSVAHAECNLRDLFFGQVELQIVTHDDPVMRGLRYETAVIVNGYKIVGQLGEPERDGSRPILNAAGENCGSLEENLHITGGDLPLIVRRVTPNSFVVFNGDSPVGTIKGRLNNDEDKASDPAALRRAKRQR
jgi:hypothetical protein